jgi:hypothetical protein
MLTEIIHPDFNKIVFDVDEVTAIYVAHGSFDFIKGKSFFTKTEYYKSVMFEPYKIIIRDKHGDKMMSFQCGNQNRMSAYRPYDSAFLENFGDDDVKYYQQQLANSKEKMQEIWKWLTTDVFDVNKVYFNDSGKV